jgi:hypothetical protein|tara:strand:+ start:197 stop:664 length:468 start_codon:yes stop_codon:yes gene_type:complete
MTLQEKIASFTPVKYNQFYWWRRFKSRDTLSPRNTLYEKIKHGDYEMSDYFYQAKWEKILMEEKLSKIDHPDDKLEATKLCMERHRRLMTDYEKDEANIWKDMCKDFRATFKVSEDELEQYMEKCEGTLIDLYNMVKQDYINKRPDKAYVYAMEN